MVRGTTAQFKFSLPYNYEDLLTAKITFWQRGETGPAENRPLPIVKTLAQCSQSNIPTELYVTLNQEETLRFSDKKKAYVQLRALSSEGGAFASKPEIVTVYPIYDDDIIGDVELPTPSPSDNDEWIVLDGEAIG